MSVLLGSRLPRVSSHPPYAVSYGPEATELAASAGLILDGWQQDELDRMLGIDGHGRFVCPEYCLMVPRQNGKSVLFQARSLTGLYLLGEPLIMWSAHEYKTAMEGFRAVQGLIENSPDLESRLFKVSNTNGSEGLELKGEGGNKITGRQRLRFVARSKGSGRGFSAPVNLMDEWFAGTDAQVSALIPAMAAFAGSQVVYASSPPLDAVTGEPLARLMDRGEKGGDPYLGYSSWGAEPGVDTDDEQEWARSNPALGIRISVDTLRRNRLAMSAEDFAREHLGVRPARAGKRLITPEQWQALLDEDSRREGVVAFGIDVTPSRDYAAIAVAGHRGDGLWHVELVDMRPGTGWVADEVARLVERHRPCAVGVDLGGPAASLVLDLERAGVAVPHGEPEFGQLALADSAAYAVACAQLVDACNQDSLRHIGQRELAVAIDAAQSRPLGDRWAWGRRTSTGNISPLVAVTVAVWAWAQRAHLAVEEDYDVLASVH